MKMTRMMLRAILLVKATTTDDNQQNRIYIVVSLKIISVVMKFLTLLVLLVVLVAVNGLVSSRPRVLRGQMAMMARKPIMAGNWKMNTDLEVRG